MRAKRRSGKIESLCPWIASWQYKNVCCCGISDVFFRCFHIFTLQRITSWPVEGSCFFHISLMSKMQGRQGLICHTYYVSSNYLDFNIKQTESGHCRQYTQVFVNFINVNFCPFSAPGKYSDNSWQFMGFNICHLMQWRDWYQVKAK